MANRKEKPRHFGLKEAYSVLQKDFLTLKDHCTGIEEHLMAIQSNYLILEQSHQQLQQDSQEEKGKLIEKLEKSYDAYNEKYMKVEMLEDQIKEFAKSKIKENEQLNKNEEENNKTSQAKENQFQTEILNGVKKSLSEVGLSLVKTDEEFKVNLLNIKHVERFLSSKYCIVEKSVASEMKDLKETKRLLEESFYSLKQHSENQNKEISKIREEFQKKTEACLKLNEEVNKLKNEKVILDISTQVNNQDLPKVVLSAGKNNVIMKREVFERIIARLQEMSNFTAELKKTILDQSSWIEMLVVSIDDYKASISQKQPGSLHEKNHFDVSRSGIKIDVTSHEEKHRLNTDQSSIEELYQNYPEALSLTENHFGDSESTLRDVVLPLSSSEGDEKVLGYRGKPKVDTAFSGKSHLSKKDGTEKLSKVRKSSSLSSHHGNDRDHEQPGIYQSLNVDRSTTGAFSNLPTNDMCPMCDVIFDATYDLAERRTHINRHFYS